MILQSTYGLPKILKYSLKLGTQIFKKFDEKLKSNNESK